MKIFIGQAVTGENIPEIKKELVEVYTTLEKAGHDVYDTLRDGPKELGDRPKDERLEYAFQRIDERDTFLAIIRSERRSEGLSKEWEYARSKGKRMLAVVREDISSPLEKEAEIVRCYKDKKDLVNQLREL
ncbi:MAG TPA: hypothetical protein VJZ93_02070 [Candidatus Nanoarchaeia archaeon]|nr:hypothetical protein [Candidatus Nanoarchaeia archaeon]